MIREIPKDEWPKFFDVFSRQHEGWLVTLEIFGNEIGAQIQERELVLGGIVADGGKIQGNQIASSLVRSATIILLTVSHARLK